MFRCLRPLWEIAPHFGSSSTPSTTTTSGTSSPWSGQVPYLTSQSTGPNQINGVFPAAAQLYNNQSDWPQYYPTSTYSPLTGQQNQFINQAQNYGASGGDSAINGANDTVLQTALPGYTAQTGSAFGQANPEIGNLASGSVANQTNPAFAQGQQYLSSMLSGSTLNPFTAPGFQNVINGTLANVIPATTSSFINGGRSDSGLAQAATTNAATNAIGSLANQNYLQEQGLQSTAEGQASQNQALGLNTALTAGGLASNNLLTQQGNQIKGAAVAPGIDQSQLGDINAALTAAGMGQTNNQNQLNYDVAKYNYGQTLPFNMLGQYQNYVGGTGYGGTTTGQTTTPYYSSTLGNILSGVTGAVGLANGVSSLAGYPSLGGANGSLAALYALSDRRLKTDIQRVGQSDSGFPMFSYRYKWDEPGTARVGLMAQDVARVRPDAVAHTPFGMAVDYRKALAA